MWKYLLGQFVRYAVMIAWEISCSSVCSVLVMYSISFLGLRWVLQCSNCSGIQIKRHHCSGEVTNVPLHLIMVNIFKSVVIWTESLIWVSALSLSMSYLAGACTRSVDQLLLSMPTPLMSSKAEVPKLLWVKTHLGISCDPLNEMSTKNCFLNCGQNMPIYRHCLEISLLKTVNWKLGKTVQMYC